MAILIHKVQKQKNEKVFLYEMTPEKKFEARKKSTTFLLGSIDLNHTEDIIIIDKDVIIQKKLKNYLSTLKYKNIYCLQDLNELFLHLITKKTVSNISVFCFCDYAMLLLPDWNFISEKMEKIGVDFSIIVMLKNEKSNHDFKKIYKAKIVDTIIKPIKLPPLKKVLFKHLGPPLKKIAQ